jgi:hypothetical protein
LPASALARIQAADIVLLTHWAFRVPLADSLEDVLDSTP